MGVELAFLIDIVPASNVSVPYLTLVVRADPDFQRLKHRQLEYEFSDRRQFYADPTICGAYEHNN